MAYKPQQPQPGSNGARLQDLLARLTTSILPGSGVQPSALLPNKAAVPGEPFVGYNEQPDVSANVPDALLPSFNAAADQLHGAANFASSPLGIASAAYPPLGFVTGANMAGLGAMGAIRDTGRLKDSLSQGHYAQAGGDLVNTAGDVGMVMGGGAVSDSVPGGMTIHDRRTGTDIMHGMARLNKFAAAVIDRYDPKTTDEFVQHMVQHGGPDIFQIQVKKGDGFLVKDVAPEGAMLGGQSFLERGNMSKLKPYSDVQADYQSGQRAKGYYREGHGDLIDELGGDTEAVNRARDLSYYESAAGAGMPTEHVIKNSVKGMKLATNDEPGKVFGGLWPSGVADRLGDSELHGQKQGPYQAWKEYWLKKAAKEKGLDVEVPPMPNETVQDQRQAMQSGIEPVWGMDTGRDFLDARTRMLADDEGVGLDEAQAGGWRGFQDRTGRDSAPASWAGLTRDEVKNAGGSDAVFGALNDRLGAIRDRIRSQRAEPDAVPTEHLVGPVADWHNANEGFTYDHRSGQMISDGFAYVPADAQSRAVVHEGTKLKPKQIADFIAANEDKLRSDGRAHVGGWVDDGKSYMDVSYVAPTLDHALQDVGPGEKAIWDIKNGKEVRLDWDEHGLPHVAGDKDFNFGENIVPQDSTISNTDNTSQPFRGKVTKKALEDWYNVTIHEVGRQNSEDPKWEAIPNVKGNYFPTEGTSSVLATDMRTMAESLEHHEPPQPEDRATGTSGVRSTVTLKDGRILKSPIVPHGGPLQTHLSLIEEHGVDPSHVVDTGFEIDGEPSQGGGGSVGRGMQSLEDYERGRTEPYVPYAKRKNGK